MSNFPVFILSKKSHFAGLVTVNSIGISFNMFPICKKKYKNNMLIQRPNCNWIEWGLSLVARWTKRLIVHPISGRTLRRLPPVWHQMPSTPQPTSFVSQDELNGLEKCGVLGIPCHTSGSLLKSLPALRINRLGHCKCSLLRSFLHKISTRIRIFSPGLENNHTLKCCFGNFPA